MSIFDRLLPLVGGIAGGLMFGPGAAAFGSGLGTTIATGDLSKGIVSGALGYGLSSGLDSLAGMGAAVPGTQAGMASGAGFGAAMPQAAAQTGGRLAQAASNATMDNIGTALMQPGVGIPLAVGGLGALETLTAPGMPSTGGGDEEKIKGRRDPNAPKKISMPGRGYRPGIDPEWRYFADGGQVEEEKKPAPPQTYNRETAWYNWNPRDNVRLAPIAPAAAAPAPAAPAPAAPAAAMAVNALTARPDPNARFFSMGGHVAGPGGPRDDMIPAMLSNGEYVLPAHFVRATGGGGAWDARVTNATGRPTATSGLGAL